MKPRPARVGGWETQKSNPHVTSHPPAAVAHHPQSCKVCSFFVLAPLPPSLSERQSKPRCLCCFDFAIRPPGTQTRGPRWNTKWFNQTKKKKKNGRCLRGRQAAASWSPRWVPAPRGVQDREVVLFSSRSAVLILKDSRLLLPSQPGVGCLPAVIHPHQPGVSRCI